MPETGAATTTWRGIDELAEVVGGYCWVEKRIFEVAGAWATGARRPAVSSRRCGSGVPACPVATASWRPAGPSGSRCERAWTGRRWWCRPTGRWPRPSTWWPPPPTPRHGVAALVETVLPRLLAVYEAHRQAPNPVSEASVLEVLAGAHRDLADEISRGRALLEES